MQLVPPVKWTDDSDCLQGDLVLSGSTSYFDGSELRLRCKQSITDIWILGEQQDAVLSSAKCTFASSSQTASHSIQFQVSPLLSNFYGLLLPRLGDIEASSSTFVPIASSIAVLRHLALSVVSKTPIILSSRPSAGKTTVCNHLCTQFGVPADQLVTLDLSDRSIDAKSLIGTLTSSVKRPGSFSFVEGIVTRCLRLGRWLLVANIDRGSDDVLVLLASVVEAMLQNKTPMVRADGREVHAAPSFMLFATRSSSHSNRRLFGEHLWDQIELQQPTESDLLQIISMRYPKLTNGIAQELVLAWSQLPALPGPSSRLISVRQLFRWCSRLEATLPSDLSLPSLSSNPSLQEEAFLDAFDLFLSPYSNTASQSYTYILNSLTTSLQLSEDRVSWLLHSRSITTSSSTTTLKCGRAIIPVFSNPICSDMDKTFTLTRPVQSLLERIAVAVMQNESVLLVGETGTGKTTTVTHLAHLLGKHITTINLSTQTESSDLIGGFKPLNVDLLTHRKLTYISLYQAKGSVEAAQRLTARFTDLFDETFGLARNSSYIESVQTALRKSKWSRLLALIRESNKQAQGRIDQSLSNGHTDSAKVKRRKTATVYLKTGWSELIKSLDDFEKQYVSIATKGKMVFKFIEGPLVRALVEGHWILLDEINLATSETLDILTSLLRSSPSLVLSEQGDLEPVQRHPDFRLFGCMNPATDVGKRDLLPDLRARFSEFYVVSPDQDSDSLRNIVAQYLSAVAVGDRAAIADASEAYSSLKSMAEQGQIADGTNQPPHFSLRTLTRALRFAVANASSFGLRRAIYEGFLMTFTTSLDAASNLKVVSFLQKAIFKTAERANTILSRPPVRFGFTAFFYFWPFYIVYWISATF